VIADATGRLPGVLASLARRQEFFAKQPCPTKLPILSNLLDLQITEA
jgi:hypothetical protein